MHAAADAGAADAGGADAANTAAGLGQADVDAVAAGGSATAAAVTSPPAPWTRDVQSLQARKKALKQEQSRLQKELKAAKARKQRALAATKRLTTEDLVSLIQARGTAAAP